MIAKLVARAPQSSHAAYTSPYPHHGGILPYHNGNLYISLLKNALNTLEAMGYDPQTMVESGLIPWTEEQFTGNHDRRHKYLIHIEACMSRVMKSYNEFASEYKVRVEPRSVFRLVRAYNSRIWRQVISPDAVGIFR